MERYSLKKANLAFQQNPWNISVIQKFQENFKMGFRFCWAAVCSHVSLLTTNPASKKMFKVSKRYDIKSIKNTRKNQTRYFEKITVQNHDWIVIPRLCTNLSSKFCFQFLYINWLQCISDQPRLYTYKFFGSWSFIYLNVTIPYMANLYKILR